MLTSTAICFLLLSGLAQAAAPVAFLNFKGADQGRIVIDVKVNDKGPYPFLFDTGSLNIISMELANQLGAKVSGKGTMAAFGGSVETGSAILDSIKLGELTMGRTEVTAIGGGPFTKGEPVGMLGWEFLSKLVVEIDYEHGKLNLYDPQTYAYTGHGVRVPITVGGTNMLSIPGTVFGSTAALQLDTGSEVPLVLFPKFVALHHLQSQLHAITGYGFGGLTRAMITRAPALTIGSYAIESPVVQLSLDASGIESGTADGNIGGPLLHQFTCVFDVPHKSFYLEPNAWFGKGELTDRSGLVLDTRGDSAKVLFVYPGSPAAKAKITGGDEVSDGNGHSLSAAGWHDLTDRAKGTIVLVTVNHRGHLRKASLTLSDYL